MDARAIIAKLRDGTPPGREELSWFANGLASGAVSDAQAGAFAMAVLLNGLGEEGRVALTLAMRDSGDVLRWDLPGPVLDKHSTGGVGDSVSLVLAPLLAAAGAYVPMVSGRGLGHTGGTLDKMEAIPGVDTRRSEEDFRRIVTDCGCAIVSATGDIAPADRRLYAIRDVSGTVESIDLITASILSKKLAAGLEGLVLDVKCGSGAFMKTLEDARALAQALVTTANGAGCPTTALITDNSQPLIPSLGNALEVAEAVEVLTERPEGALADLSIALGAELLVQAGMDATLDAAATRLAGLLASGAAAERFGRMVAALGGPRDFLENWETILPPAADAIAHVANRDAVITAIDAERFGRAVVALGGGRRVETDVIDPAVGITNILAVGDAVQEDDMLFALHFNDPEKEREAADLLRDAISYSHDYGHHGDLSDTPRPDVPPLILERVTA